MCGRKSIGFLRLSQPSVDSYTVGSILVTELFLEQALVSYDDRFSYPGDNAPRQENNLKRF